MDPTLRGLAISNSEKIKIEHNKFSHPEPFIFTKTKAEDGVKKRRDYVQNLIEKKGEVSNEKDLEEYNKMTKEQLEISLKDLDNMIKNNEVTIKDEEFKVKKYREENERRQFNYIGFIYELMKTLAEKGKLKEMYKEACDEVEAKQKEKEKQKENEKK